MGFLGRKVEGAGKFEAQGRKCKSIPSADGQNPALPIIRNIP